jgi:hypothetical protein
MVCRWRIAPPRACLPRGRLRDYGWELAIDDMPQMALVSTSGTDAIITAFLPIR